MISITCPNCQRVGHFDEPSNPTTFLCPYCGFNGPLPAGPPTLPVAVMIAEPISNPAQTARPGPSGASLPVALPIADDLLQQLVSKRREFHDISQDMLRWQADLARARTRFENANAARQEVGCAAIEDNEVQVAATNAAAAKSSLEIAKVEWNRALARSKRFRTWRAIRDVAESMEMPWWVFGLANATAFLAVFTLLAIPFASGMTVVFAVAILGFVIGFGLVGFLLLVPDDDVLEERREAAQSDLREQTAKLETARSRHALAGERFALLDRLHRLSDEYRRAEVDYRRAQDEVSRLTMLQDSEKRILDRMEVEYSQRNRPLG